MEKRKADRTVFETGCKFQVGAWEKAGYMSEERQVVGRSKTA
jgi:hypothetical protein